MNIEATSLSKNICKDKRKLWEFTISLPTRYENWPNASMKGIDSMSPASRMPLLLCGENILSPAPECLQLWERLSKIISYFAIGCNDTEWLFTYCTTKFNDTDISWLFCAINWIHCDTFNPLLYFICDVWHNLIKRISA